MPTKLATDTSYRLPSSLGIPQEQYEVGGRLLPPLLHVCVEERVGVRRVRRDDAVSAPTEALLTRSLLGADVEEMAFGSVRLPLIRRSLLMPFQPLLRRCRERADLFVIVRRRHEAEVVERLVTAQRGDRLDDLAHLAAVAK